MIWLQLFYVYLKIGIFGFGGGYAMLSLIQADVVDRYGWISSQEFTDIVAISQMTPGPIGINSATYIGYTAIHNAGYSPAMAVLGSCLTTFPASAGHLIRLCQIQEQQICSSRVLRPPSGYGRPDCGSGFAIDE